ncbi:MAG: hypothetical protein ABI346_02050 [Candidatus Baltobacteraceae bacterium]
MQHLSLRTRTLAHIPALFAVLVASALLTLPSAAGASCAWNLTPTVNPSQNNLLVGVAGSSSSDAWTVGFSASSPRALTLAEHWNGTAWTLAATPNPSSYGNILSAVADLSATNAWAVGKQYVDSSGNPQALILHWDGSVWSVVPAPTLAGSYTNLFRMRAISPTNIWAVGRSYSQSSGLPGPLIEHWNGTTWKIIVSPNLGAFGGSLDAVSATAANDVWVAGGTYTNSSYTSFVTLTEHWNGFKWKIVPSPNANNNDNVLNALVSIAKNDAWAVGDYYTGSIFQTLTERWNGSAWSIVKSPDVGAAGDGIFGVAALSSRSVWAVGESFTASGGGSTLSLKWNGTKWTVVPSPNLAGGNPDVFEDANAVPGGTTFWAAGASFYPSTGRPDQTLAARYVCAASADPWNPGGEGANRPRYRFR